MFVIAKRLASSRSYRTMAALIATAGLALAAAMAQSPARTSHSISMRATNHVAAATNIPTKLDAGPPAPIVTINNAPKTSEPSEAAEGAESATCQQEDAAEKAGEKQEDTAEKGTDTTEDTSEPAGVKGQPESNAGTQEDASEKAAAQPENTSEKSAEQTEGTSEAAACGQGEDKSEVGGATTEDNHKHSDTAKGDHNDDPAKGAHGADSQAGDHHDR